MTAPGVHQSQLTFSYPALEGWRWPAVDIVGQRPGPRLAVIAGIHVNETSSIEAAIRLQRAIASGILAGRDLDHPHRQPSGHSRTVPICLPARQQEHQLSLSRTWRWDIRRGDGVCDLNDWAADADVLVDLHGGDLCETVSHFMVVQCTGNAAFDQRALTHARCFDAELIVRLSPSHMQTAGRSCTGRALRKQDAAFAEAGRIGLIEERNVEFHLEGVLRLAHQLNMIPSAPPCRREPVIADDYLWVPAPMTRFTVIAWKQAKKSARAWCWLSAKTPMAIVSRRSWHRPTAISSGL